MDDRLFNRINKAMSDERRLEILRAIADKGEVNCGQVAEQFPIAQATVSHHLKILVDADLILVKRSGQHSIFTFNQNVFKGYLSELAGRFEKQA